MATKKVAVVKETLQRLHDSIISSKIGQQPGEEATVLRNLIMVVAGEMLWRYGAPYCIFFSQTCIICLCSRLELQWE
jgi:hypothetical protein